MKYFDVTNPDLSVLHGLKAVGCEENENNKDRLSFLSHYFLPEEVKEVLKMISKKVLRRWSDIGIEQFSITRGAFSWEFSESGERTFFMLDYRSAFKLVSYLQELHLYEVIPEGKPCHLYFDIEYLFEEHPDWDGNAIVSKLVGYVSDRLLVTYDCYDFEVIDLSATTTKKFSRHLVFHSDDFCFKNNAHAGKFVEQEIMIVPEFAHVIDMSVYSKNRNFRCIWSTKVANKTLYPLKPMDGTNSFPGISSFEFFQKTLICCVNPKSRVLESNVDAKDDTLQPTSTSVSKKKTIKAPISTGSTSDHQIEQFVVDNMAVGGVVSRTKFNASSNTVTFIISGTRFCRRIQREHKSNHIYVNCNLYTGKVVQKCTDPECRGFESDPVMIPEIMLKQLRQKYAPNVTFTTNPVKRATTQSKTFQQLMEEMEKDLDYSD